MNLIDALKWRYATKRMNGTKVPAEKIEIILEASRLTATSMGLQPFSMVLVSNEELKKKLKPAAMEQPQIEEASHLLVFAAWKDITAKEVEAYVSLIAETRGVSLESLSLFQERLMGIVNGRTTAQKHEWAARQAYIAFGSAIAAAALEQVDATPMEGFIPAQVDEILGLGEKGLTAVTILALGYRDAEKDYMVNQVKVRRSMDHMVLRLA